MAPTTTITEAEILEKVLGASDEKVDPQVAQAWLTFRFDAEATRTIRRLLQKNNRGTITEKERQILDKYLRVGTLLDVLHARARAALRGGGRKS